MTQTSNNVFRSNKFEPEVNGDPASAETPSLTGELIRLNDDFGEFSDVSAFMCNAFANALQEHERLNKEIISGARICSDWLQQKTSELKDDIRHVRMRYVAEHNQASPNDQTKTNEPVLKPPRHRAFKYFY
jgi:hypothetical protein